jgi:hypothetical protein
MINTKSKDISDEKLKQNYIEQKELLSSLNKSLEQNCELKKDKKIVLPNGFNELENVPESIRTLLKLENKCYTRQEVINLLYEYFVKNDMIDKRSKMKINPNDTVRNVFRMTKEDKINFYNLQKWLGDLYE